MYNDKIDCEVLSQCVFFKEQQKQKVDNPFSKITVFGCRGTHTSIIKYTIIANRVAWIFVHADDWVSVCVFYGFIFNVYVFGVKTLPPVWDALDSEPANTHTSPHNTNFIERDWFDSRMVAMAVTHG